MAREKYISDGQAPKDFSEQFLHCYVSFTRVMIRLDQVSVTITTPLTFFI